jgi:hypothetical protein
VAAFDVILLSRSTLMRLKWVNDRSRQFTKTANHSFLPRKIAGTSASCTTSGGVVVEPTRLHWVHTSSVTVLSWLWHTTKLIGAAMCRPPGKCALTWMGKESLN